MLIHFPGQFEAREGQYVPSSFQQLLLEADERIIEDPCSEPRLNVTEYGIF